MSSHDAPLPPRTFSQKLVSNLLAWFGWLVEKLLTRTTIIGKENIPKQGPLLFVANHFSTYDALLLQVHLPRAAYFVGPGDFKLAMGATWVLKNAGIILTNRGAVDRQSLKYMDSVLKSGGMLAIFPEGGTWEKRIEDVKPGAVYLSHSTNTPILPMAFGGTYRVWYDIVRFKRPRVEIRIGEVLPPTQLSGDRKTRQAELDQASIDLMRLIYTMLPAADQARYDLVARQYFTGTWEEQGTSTPAPTFNGVAELLAKPNLFAPLQNYGKAALDPLTKHLGEFVPAAAMHTALTTLQQLFAESFVGFLEYRLGDDKAQAIYAELAQLIELSQAAQNRQATVRFISQTHVHDVQPIAEHSATSMGG